MCACVVRRSARKHTFAQNTSPAADVKRTPFKCPEDWKDNAFLGKFKFKAHKKVMANITGDEMEVDATPASTATSPSRGRGWTPALVLRGSLSPL